MSKRLHYYQQRILHFRQELEQIRKKVTLLARLRLVTILAVVLLLFYQNYVPYFFIPLLGLISAFLYLVRRFADVQAQQELLAFKLKLNEQEYRYCNTHQLPEIFPILYKSHERDDLDIFGRHSLFQIINRITSPQGQQRLGALLAPERIPNPTQVLLQQAANRELQDKEEFRQHFIALTYQENKDNSDYTSLLQWSADNPRIYTNYFAIIRYSWMLISLSGAVCAIYFDWSWLFTPIIAIAWIINGRFKKHCDELGEIIGKHHALMKKYTEVFRNIEQESFHAEKLKQIQMQAQDAAVGVRALAAVSARFDTRKNVLGNFLLTTFGLHDLLCISEAEQWRNQYGKYVAGWFDALAEMEVLVSTATFAFNHPHFTAPQLSEESVRVEAKELGHPLIAPNHVISNDVNFSLPAQLILVTGSNMSGKSTFLRTLGLNIVLANAGCVVAATYFHYTPAPVLSSIRVTDSLEENTSLFFQELKQLQHILTQLQTGQPAYVLLDEILRGTNSDDKYNGAFQFLEKLLPLPALTIFATHDLKLCAMEQTHAPKVNNYKFEGVVTNDELHFAYKIERGIVQNRTASFLMRQLGLID